MSVVGLIPARAASRRLPGKNLLPLHGRPLIAYTCRAALESNTLDAVYVNTDSEDIAAAAVSYGVSCPRLRPCELAGDHATTRDANRFLLSFLAEHGERYDAVMVLQPTSPLRTADDIRAAWGMFEANAPCAVVSVTPVAPAAWFGSVTKDGRLEPLVGQETIYRLNGAIYIYTYQDYVRDLAPRKTLAYPMPASRSVDVDTAEDLRHAEYLLQHAGAV